MKNQIQDLTEIVTSFIDYTHKQFEGIQIRFDSQDRRFDSQDKRFDLHDNKLDSQNTRLERLEQNQTKMLYQLEGLQASVDRLESKKEDRSSVDDLEDRLELVETDVEKLKKSVYQ